MPDTIQGLGAFVAGDYIPGADGRGYGDLKAGERLDVIEAYYRDIWRESGELELEADRVARMATKAERALYMDSVREKAPERFDRLARAVRRIYAELAAAA